MVALGGHAWLLWGGVWLLQGFAWLLPGGLCGCSQEGGVHGEGGMHGEGACMVKGGKCGKGGGVWRKGGACVAEIRPVIARAVRILLECILVQHCFAGKNGIKWSQ